MEEGPFPPGASYREWCERYEAIAAEDRALIAARLEALPHRPCVSILLPIVGGAPDLLRRAIASVAGQLYPNWELCIADLSAGGGTGAADAVRRVLDEFAADGRIIAAHRAGGGDEFMAPGYALEAATGEFALFLGAEDELSEIALYLLVEELNRQPDADLVYSDEDTIAADDARERPHFKPDWNPDLFLGCDYIGNMAAWRRSAAAAVGGLRPAFAAAQVYDLLLRLADRTTADRIRHLPFVLYHARDRGAPTPDGDDDAVHRALAEHFARQGEPGVEIAWVAGTRYRRIVRPVPSPPPVSLIVPTAGRLDLLRRAVDGILHGTAYEALELIVSCNTCPDDAVLAYFGELRADPRVKLMQRPAPFNFSRICNEAVAAATGEIVGLINDDVEIIDPGWLREMVSHAVRPEVGAVGAMLYYPDDTVEHAGVILGLGAEDGIAAHVHRRLGRGRPGYFGRAMLAQEMSCVTAACMVLRRQVYIESGGFDELLPVDFNDVDFCIGLRDRGCLIVWTPFAALRHHGSATRRQHTAAQTQQRLDEAVAYIRTKWGRAVFDRDPYHNPNLRRDGEDYSLGRPRLAKPWR